MFDFNFLSLLYFHDLENSLKYFTKIKLSPHPSSLVAIVHHAIEQAIEFVRHLLYLHLLNNQILLNLKIHLEGLGQMSSVPPYQYGHLTCRCPSLNSPTLTNKID